MKLNYFPYTTPNTLCSKWYTYPQMTNDECLMFLQYDHLTTQPYTETKHCSIQNDVLYEIEP